MSGQLDNVSFFIVSTHKVCLSQERYDITNDLLDTDARNVTSLTSGLPNRLQRLVT